MQRPIGVPAGKTAFSSKPLPSGHSTFRQSGSLEKRNYFLRKNFVNLGRLHPIKTRKSIKKKDK